MRRILPLLLIVLFLMLAAGCQSEQENIYESALGNEGSSKPMIIESAPEGDAPTQNSIAEPSAGSAPAITPVPEDNLSGQLTVKMFWWSDVPNVYLLAQEFMRMHPHVTIDFDYEIDLYQYANLTKVERNMQLESYLAHMRTELASGEADYILFGSYEQVSNLYQLSRSGVLLDMRHYWEKDSDINPEDYFMEALNAFAVDGKMTVMPFSFMFDGVYLNRSILDRLEIDPSGYLALSSNDILDWYEQARETDPELQLFFSAPGKDALFSQERYRYLDMVSESASFSSPEFVKFLERTNSVIDDDPELDEDEIGRAYGALADELLRYQATGKEPLSVSKEMPTYNIVTKGRTSFATTEAIESFQLVNFQQPLKYMAGPFPLTSSDGKLGLSSIDDFAISTGCKNPELAWEFIKHCISKRDDMTFTDVGWYNNWYTQDIPVNKMNYKTMIEGMPEYIKHVGIDGYANFNPVDGELLTQKLEQVFKLELVNARQYSMDVSEFLEEYYDRGLTTAQECAGKIQGRAEIWLGE